jgi:hypothetical protein
MFLWGDYVFVHVDIDTQRERQPHHANHTTPTTVCRMDVDIDIPTALPTMPSHSKLVLPQAQLTALNNTMAEDSRQGLWEARMDNARRNESVQKSLFIDVWHHLMEALGVTDLKIILLDRPDFDLKTSVTVEIMKGLNDDEVKAWTSGIQKGVKEENWVDLIVFGTYSRVSEDPTVIHSYMTAKLRAGTISPSSSNSSNVSEVQTSLAQIEEKIEKISDKIRPRIEKFLQQPNPPAWIPPSAIVDANHRTFLTNLRIPTYEDGRPSLLLHELADADESKAQDIFNGTHQCVSAN